MKEQQINTYEFKHNNLEIHMHYEDDAFSSATGLYNGQRPTNETDFTRDLNHKIEDTIDQLMFLQQLRKDNEKIVAKHAAARAETERRMLG